MLFRSKFAKAAALVFDGPDRRKPPYSGVSSFLDAPYRPEASAEGFVGLEIALIGVPMDLGVTTRAGARNGPRAVRAVERGGPYEHVLRMAPLGEARFADIGDVPMRSRFSSVSNPSWNSIPAIWRAPAWNSPRIGARNGICAVSKR